MLRHFGIHFFGPKLEFVLVFPVAAIAHWLLQTVVQTDAVLLKTYSAVDCCIRYQMWKICIAAEKSDGTTEFPDRRFPTPRKAKRVAEEEYQTKVAYTTEEAEHDLAQQFSTWFKERLHWAATGITLDSANLVSDLHMCQKAGKQR